MDVTDVKVVDASALAAVIFNEPEAEEIAGRLRGAILVAPVLLKYEIVNVALMKLHRNPDQRAAILQAFKLKAGLTLAMEEVDYAGTLLLAEETGLTGYDASYLWLARRLNAELVTLDRALARATAPAAPDG